MNILVTGALGFIGSHTCIRLLNAGHKVLAFDNLSNPSIASTDRIKAASGENWKNFTFYKVDIRDLSHMSSIIHNNPIDSIIHLAAMGSVPRSFERPEDYIDINEKGFANVFLLASISTNRHLVYASSSSVYGLSADRYESTMPLPRSPYALTKLQNEYLSSLLGGHRNITTIGLRFFNVYGVGQRHDSPYSAVIPKFIHGNEININGDGSIVRDFTHVDDVVDAIYLSLSQKQSNVFNVCTGIGTSINELAKIISNGKKKINYLPERFGDVKKSVGDPYKAHSLLGFRAKRRIQFELQRLMCG